MKEYLQNYAPYVENVPIPKQTLIQRFRSHVNTAQGEGKSRLQLLYMLKFVEAFKNRNGEVVLN